MNASISLKPCFISHEMNLNILCTRTSNSWLCSIPCSSCEKGRLDSDVVCLWCRVMVGKIERIAFGVLFQ